MKCMSPGCDKNATDLSNYCANHRPSRPHVYKKKKSAKKKKMKG